MKETFSDAFKINFFSARRQKVKVSFSAVRNWHNWLLGKSRGEGKFREVRPRCLRTPTQT